MMDTTLTIAEVAPDDTDASSLGPAAGNPVAVYLATLSSPRSRRTMRIYLTQLARLATGNPQQQPEAVPWQQMRYQHVAAIRAALTERLHYAPKSANTALAALRGVLQACWRLGLMSGEDYHRARDVPRVAGERLLAGREITSGERAALFASCAADESAAGRRDAALIAILYVCMVRNAEAAALRLEDYEPDERRFRIVGKGNKEHFVYVNAPGAVEALDDWLRERAACGLPPDSGPLFVRTTRGGHVGWTAEPLTGYGLQQALEGRARKAGVARFTPHDFRRTGIGDLLDAGIDLALVSRLVGHSNVQTTAKYDRRPEEAKRKAASVLHVPYMRRAG